MQTQDLRRILLVDDESDIREIAELALEDIGGYHVKTCESGDEALHTIPAFQPDLVLLDVMMTRMSGTEVLEKIRALPESEKTPVIFMTAKVQRKEVEMLKELSAIGVIEKPFEPMELTEQIESYWREFCKAVS